MLSRNPQFINAKKTLGQTLQDASRLTGKLARYGSLPWGRLRHLVPVRLNFRGAFASYDEALRAIPPHRLAGYNHLDVAPVSFEAMCRIMPWDYPVLFWLGKLLPSHHNVLDAGGHMGTKYRAFSKYLDLNPPVNWTVWDLPEIVRAGKSLATDDGLKHLAFIDDLDQAQNVDVLLASGLFQYMPQTISGFLEKLPHLPKHILLNKVAVRDGHSVVTLETIGPALVPYQFRSRETLFNGIHELGYNVVDTWEINSLSHSITTHPELGRSQSLGFYLKRR